MSSLSTSSLLLLVAFSFVLLSIATTPTNAFIDGAFQKVQKDFASLTRRVTARHILVSDEKIAQVLKQKIRNECIEKELFVIDTFEEAAKKYSKDDTTNFRGGLLGELVPQGKKKER
ncbi:MAG: parvulin-like peptidyl-prolyl isomerase [Bacillariaceae sp.]|jgi:parvulin-like peptidyl-prolyl isomerase